MSFIYIHINAIQLPYRVVYVGVNSRETRNGYIQSGFVHNAKSLRLQPAAHPQLLLLVAS